MEPPKDSAGRRAEALAVSAAAGTIASPVSHLRLLEMIVETAAHVLRANAASLLLLDDETEELVFQVATGPKADEARNVRVPLGHGVAGTVAVTGQPLAIAGDHHPVQARDLSEQIGYEPSSLLCVPLYYGDRIIGVLELLDKRGADSFGPDDIDALTLFANQAAVAIEYSRTQGDLAAAAAGLDPAYGRTLELARLVHEIAQRGDAEFTACRALLTGFAEYLRSRGR